MKDAKTRKLVLAALLTAICCVLTMVVQVPSPMNGYVNLGDCGVLLAAWLLGPFYGGAAAGLGSMLADLFSGYAHYAPGTLVIKSAMAVAAALGYSLLHRRGEPGGVYARAISAIAAECVMVAGYFLYACILLGNGWGAVASIPGNLVQGVFGLVSGVLVAEALVRTKSVFL